MGFTPIWVFGAMVISPNSYGGGQAAGQKTNFLLLAN